MGITAGALIRKQRQKLGMKVLELAQRVKVSPVYITQIERHNKLPSHDVLMKIVGIVGDRCEIHSQHNIYNRYLKAKHPNIWKHLIYLLGRSNNA